MAIEHIIVPTTEKLLIPRDCDNAMLQRLCATLPGCGTILGEGNYSLWSKTNGSTINMLTVLDSGIGIYRVMLNLDNPEIRQLSREFAGDGFSNRYKISTMRTSVRDLQTPNDIYCLADYSKDPLLVQVHELVRFV